MEWDMDMDVPEKDKEGPERDMEERDETSLVYDSTTRKVKSCHVLLGIIYTMVCLNCAIQCGIIQYVTIVLILRVMEIISHKIFFGQKLASQYLLDALAALLK